MADHLAGTLNAQRPRIETIRKAAGVPGLAVGVIREGRTVFEDYYGYRDVERGLSPDKDTVFFVASLTKAITVAAIGMLVDDGLMDWTTPVHDILDELHRPSPLSDAKLSVLDILSHQTGVAWADALYLQSNNNILLPKKDCIRTFNCLPIVKPPRSTFMYNNHAYNIAGLIVEKLSGKDNGTFVKERIFDPLQMTRTYTEQPRDDSNVALPYNILLDKSPFRIPFSGCSDKSMMFAGQSVRSSLGDLLRLYAEYMRPMQHLKDRLSEEDISQPRAAPSGEPVAKPPQEHLRTCQPIFKQMANIVAPRITRGAEGLLEQTYALGWNRTQLPGKFDFGWNSGLVASLPIVGSHGTLAIWHGGNMPGTTAAVCLLPEKATAIVVLQNSLGLCDAADWTCQLLVDTILAGKPLHDYVALTSESVINGGNRMNKVADRLESERILGTQHRALAAYTGRYYNALGNWFINVGICDGELYLEFQGREDERYTLRHYHYDIFVWNLDYDETVKRAQYCRPFDYYKIEFEPGISVDQNTDNPMTSIRWRHDASVPQGEAFSKTK